ncbi:Ni/Fe-hydrogenase, b-type cytochrome subunit [Desulfuribacillus stibiiarsenatis]|uniref:Ni/Fe-hydrogenase, b-type cytochrome subunit n=1 Tax=Desulfuribacillus stibiiarsenatis TaxID=1390249 RepID=A0A1E5L3E9_9FIRM|nr:Ni/Fe-hydrogenase, b-type cytochrome subunit [Desulfuribacillus stibiiarsenatis]OEH84627.1 Ni/Fe-hydrogenase, b-type cytochrome subunit [Desulfuribacillus stibiiarsenatis]
MLKRAIYIWELPVRLYHWINAFLIVALLVTGFYIGYPIFGPTGGEATENFIMGWMIYIHTLAAWFFIANIIVRFYWAFKGNEYAKFKPWRRGFAKDGLETLKYYSFMKKEHSLEHGHNVLAQLSYFFFMWVGSFIMIFTGFAMQGEMFPEGLQAKYFGWMLTLFGNSMDVRMLHHFVAWAFIWFIIIHLYLVIRQDILDEDGTISAIFNGYKFIPQDFVLDEEIKTQLKGPQKQKKNKDKNEIHH